MASRAFSVNCSPFIALAPLEYWRCPPLSLEGHPVPHVFLQHVQLHSYSLVDTSFIPTHRFSLCVSTHSLVLRQFMLEFLYASSQAYNDFDAFQVDAQVLV